MNCFGSLQPNSDTFDNLIDNWLLFKIAFWHLEMPQELVYGGEFTIMNFVTSYYGRAHTELSNGPSTIFLS